MSILRVIASFLCRFLLDLFQHLWLLAVVSFVVMLQYRFPTPNFSLARRKMGCHSHSACGHQSYLDCVALA